MNVSGRRIASVFRGPWEEHPAPELPGIAPSIWLYCSFYVEFEDGAVLHCVPRDVRLDSDKPAERAALDAPHAAAAAQAIGGVVLDVLEVEEPSVFVMLEDGGYLESALLPGGSSLIFGTLESWAREGLAESARSVFGGQVRTFRQYFRGGPTRSEAEEA